MVLCAWDEWGCAWPDKAVKIGEGTYGEAFKVGDMVAKIVPLEGAMPINGEQQKSATELLVEVDMALMLSALRGGKMELTGEWTQDKDGIYFVVKRHWLSHKPWQYQMVWLPVPLGVKFCICVCTSVHWYSS